eukprot:4234266-Lingulodinium_polyedra.AAC.1
MAAGNVATLMVAGIIDTIVARRVRNATSNTAWLNMLIVVVTTTVAGVATGGTTAQTYTIDGLISAAATISTYAGLQ